jgi:hypothetical protein
MSISTRCIFPCFRSAFSGSFSECSRDSVGGVGTARPVRSTSGRCRPATLVPRSPDPVPTRARSTSYSALLRGINLGSHKRVRMADLRELAEDLGCADVRTYVQSGNVVFRSDRSAADLTKAIEKGIEKQLGLDVIVVIRTERQLRNLVANNPFVRAKIGRTRSTWPFWPRSRIRSGCGNWATETSSPNGGRSSPATLASRSGRRRPPPSACADRVCLPRVAPRAGAGGSSRRAAAANLVRSPYGLATSMAPSRPLMIACASSWTVPVRSSAPSRTP